MFIGENVKVQTGKIKLSIILSFRRFDVFSQTFSCMNIKIQTYN